ncbi:MAG: hypothetical protein HYR84_13930 [Planctomycetes bacterium]|nr:hypothetical protein [Planctomycetota bacterium]
MNGFPFAAPRRIAVAKTPHEQTVLAAADRHIDRLVYELYGLSDDEIKIVGEAMAGSAGLLSTVPTGRR